MAKQTINIGSGANVGDGDPLRTAFSKTNANFTELYNTLLTGTVDPTVNEDSVDGYPVGALWYNYTSGVLSVMRDNAQGAAQWRSFRPAVVATTDPTATDDNTKGYPLGALWLNSASGTLFVSRDNTNGAAVWRPFRAEGVSPYVATKWYPTRRAAVVASGGSWTTAARARFYPFTVRQRCVISDLGLSVGSNEASAIACQLAIYAGDPAAGKPTGSELGKTGDITTNVGGFRSAALGADLTLEPGKLYFMACNHNGTAVQFHTGAAADNAMAVELGSVTGATAISTTQLHSLYTDLTTYSTWGNVTAASFTEETVARAPLVVMKVKTVL